jgi:hypothetical protein
MRLTARLTSGSKYLHTLLCSSNFADAWPTKTVNPNRRQDHYVSLAAFWQTTKWSAKRLRPDSAVAVAFAILPTSAFV